MIKKVMVRFSGMVLVLFNFIISLPGQEIGLQLYSLREQFKTDVQGTLAKVKNWNITKVEGGDTYGTSLHEIKNIMDASGLQTISVATDFKTLTEDPLIAVEKAKAFGAKYVVCHWIPHNGNEFSIKDIEKAVKVFNSSGMVLASNGLSLCYHPHGYEFRPHEKETLFDFLVKNTKLEYINFQMDVFWVKHAGQDPLKLLKTYPDRFLLVHLKDRKKGTKGNQNGNADPETNVVLGTGDIDIKSIISEGKKAGVKYFFLEDESSLVEKQIPKSLAYIKSLRLN